MKNFTDMLKIEKIVVKRKDNVEVWFERVEDNVWEVSFVEDNAEICPTFGIVIDCDGCTFSEDGGRRCNAHNLRVMTKEVVNLLVRLIKKESEIQ